MVDKCPHCNMDLELRAISSFDPTGVKHGCIWFCCGCGWHSLDQIITVHNGNKHLVKPAISFFEVKMQKWKNRR